MRAFVHVNSAMSLACRLCKALIDCPTEEARAFAKALGEHVLHNSSSITALDLCHPCLNEVRKASPPRVRPPLNESLVTITAT
jgi:hypothetical protein